MAHTLKIKPPKMTKKRGRIRRGSIWFDKRKGLLAASVCINYVVYHLGYFHESDAEYAQQKLDAFIKKKMAEGEA